MDQWDLVAVRSGATYYENKYLYYRHRDVARVILTAARYPIEEHRYLFIISMMVDRVFFRYFRPDGEGVAENFEPFVHEKMEDLAAPGGQLEKILAFAENTEIKPCFQSQGCDYECGMCGRVTFSENADAPFQHFVSAHFSGHSVKGAGRC